MESFDVKVNIEVYYELQIEAEDEEQVRSKIEEMRIIDLDKKSYKKTIKEMIKWKF